MSVNTATTRGVANQEALEVFTSEILCLRKENEELRKQLQYYRDNDPRRHLFNVINKFQPK